MDEEGSKLWTEAIEKEMKKARPAFTKRDDLNIQKCREGKELIEYEEIGCHMIFDVKMDGSFTRKARFVANGDETDPPSHLTHSSVENLFALLSSLLP